MNYILNDEEYIGIVKNILENDNFKKIDNLSHHGTSRLNHSLRVSYFLYKLSKLLHLDKRKVARAGLLHDFFLTNITDNKTKLVSVFKHSKEAVTNADNNFIISELEKDIIVSHMFPVMPFILPKYAESWVVNIVDKTVAIYEFAENYGNTCAVKFRNALVIGALFIGRFI